METLKKAVWIVVLLLVFWMLSWTVLGMMANTGFEYRETEMAKVTPLRIPDVEDETATETETKDLSEIVADWDDWFENRKIFDETGPCEKTSVSLSEPLRRDEGVGNTGIDISAFIASIEPIAHSGTQYEDSHGAVAYGWELNEAIRLVMLESGAESEEDIREHCALICKQLLYTQTVGGYDDWGTTLYGIIHGGHSYTETAPRIWTEAGAPTEEVEWIFWDVWFNGYLSDFRVQCFRSTCYHTWAIPAYQIGKTYYSVNPWQDFSMFDLDENGVLQYK